jgi:hypothetical protein
LYQTPFERIEDGTRSFMEPRTLRGKKRSDKAFLMGILSYDVCYQPPFREGDPDESTSIEATSIESSPLA